MFESKARLTLASSALLWISSWVNCPTALAHRTLLDVGLETGSGSLVQEFVSGQWGFAQNFPFYVHGEASHEVFYVKPADNAYRFGGEIGYESVHFAAAVRGGYLNGGYQGLTLMQWGVTFGYCFVPWKLFAVGEESLFKPQQRPSEIERRRREIDERMPKIPLVSLSIDLFDVSSGVSLRGSMFPLRIAGSARATLWPFLTLIPSAELFLYPTSLNSDPAGYRSYSSRALRLVRLGPNGFYSGIFGFPEHTQQIYSEIKIFPQLRLNAAVTRASLVTPPFVGYSFWLGFDRILTQDGRWSISPSYEQYILEKKSYSFFMIALRFGANSTYTPSFGTTP